ncbi:MAG: hypothetical protein BV458_13905 [Thermoplasmata archaeon M9B2D]|nr:MAG: hypothetical protein BV458_13905 [Thermoplasmata archaeon M9B2D]
MRHPGYIPSVNEEVFWLNFYGPRERKLFIREAKKMKRLAIISIVGFSLILVISCFEESKDQTNLDTVRKIRILISNSNFEGARLAAIDTLDPEIKSLYFDADRYLGQASHEDVRCNERIEEILYGIVKKVPTKETKLNRDIYSELLTLYPENEIYKKKFIYYDRKTRGIVQ